MAQRHVVTLGVLALMLAAAWPSAQGRGGPATAAAVDRDISGFWGLEFDGRRVPSANLVAGVTPQVLAEAAKRDAHNIRWCNLVGMPAAMDMGRPLDIRQGPTTIIMVPEAAVAAPRYVYLNRAAHIDPDIFDPSTNGDSIGRWEGDDLVVDTVGFHESHGLMAIPGGGYRTATTHLVERYRLIGNGDVMEVTFTWTDPAMFRTPHTYAFRYVRYPDTYEAVAPPPCMAWDPVRASFFDPVPATPAGR